MNLLRHHQLLMSRAPTDPLAPSAFLVGFTTAAPTVLMWDVSTWAAMPNITSSSEGSLAGTLSVDDRYVIYCTQDPTNGQIRVYDRTTESQVATIGGMGEIRAAFPIEGGAAYFLAGRVPGSTVPGTGRMYRLEHGTWDLSDVSAASAALWAADGLVTPSPVYAGGDHYLPTGSSGNNRRNLLDLKTDLTLNGRYQIAGNAITVHGVSVSPDGARVAVVTAGTGGAFVSVLDASSKSVLYSALNTRGTLGRGVFSPDGKWLAVTVNADYILILDATTYATAQTIAANQSSFLTWSNDGEYLAYVINTSSSTALVVRETTGWTIVAGPTVAVGLRYLQFSRY